MSMLIQLIDLPRVQAIESKAATGPSHFLRLVAISRLPYVIGR